MNTKTIIFFRNDDVRSTIDKSLVEITSLFIKNEISITHAVEPGNISSEVIDWLINIKRQYPHLVEIIQHGYDHSEKNKFRKGEFGEQRNYEEQFFDIRNGKDLMNKYFGNLWFPAFCFPNGSYNIEALEAVANNGFKVLSDESGNYIRQKLFYFVGHFLHKDFLFNRKVPYNLDYRLKNKIFQINANINLIVEYHNEETASTMLTLPELKTKTKRFISEKTIGILLHHRYHNNYQKIQLIADYLKWLKMEQNIQFATIEKIYSKFTF